ncbi:MAG: endopeptidase La [Bacteroidaceae bacterium]|nr:endopeptidase La [Bacteroidaceae bacterium]MBQ3874213.1 endopeptidase La [Bacteroidaceae bacterium]MBQ4462679.1 endopeptidase La [Bacteroidaceae bacterium]MBQ5352487.1 endopeptidase La [Bacteroidaceae bacterium]
MKKLIDDIFQMESDSHPASISIISDGAINVERTTNFDFEGEVPILPMRNMVLFPGVVTPVTVGRPSTLKLVKKAEKTNEFIATFCQKSPDTDEPQFDDLYTIGVLAKVLRILDMPDNSTTVILQAYSAVELQELTATEPFLRGKVVNKNEEPIEDEDEYKAVFDSCRERTITYIQETQNNPEIAFAIRNSTDDRSKTMINFICTNLLFPIADKITLLKEPSLKKRAISLMSILSREIQLASIKNKIQSKTREDINQQQKEYFLHQQMKNILNELGNSEDIELEKLREKIAEKKFDDEVREIVEREASKLERLNPQSPDYNIQYTYLQTVLSLPWKTFTKDNTNLKNAEKVLDKDHYGMEKVKERIIEHLAVLKLRGDLKSPIICLYGPPGVGKTSLGRSVAEALKRKYVRISLGGLHDESEIRGHRRTYLGAMPGRIIKGIQKAGSDNPVFILDEIDKITQNTVNGDPSSALLEVLDPEQNKAFHDNYLDIDYDLSNVMFIATANNISTIPGPLLDRMELIEVSGYITEEKLEIAKRHLIPKAKEELGLTEYDKLKIDKSALEYIIENYTRESGVRKLDKMIKQVFRKIAVQIAKDGDEAVKTVKIADLKDYLGSDEMNRDKYQGNEYAGVVTGLAWTSVGGEILFVETSLSKGKQGKLTLTGNLGDVMKESAVLALEYIKAHAEQIGIDQRIFDNWNIHIHVPEGATPKDGPSAGITIATSLASALTQRKVRAKIAMTGEITLRGKVLPVGGIKEKILAAKRAGITDIVICEDNRRNIEAIPEIYLKGVTFHYVTNVMEVLDIALLKTKVNNPLDLSIKEETKKEN